MSGDLGGDPPCWAHLFDDTEDQVDEDAIVEDNRDGSVGAVGVGPSSMAVAVVDLGATDLAGPPGVVWSLPSGGDLETNLVRLDPGGAIGSHVNDEVDVVIVVVTGRGRVVIDGVDHELHRDVLARVPRGARRELLTGEEGITYLSIHRCRGPLGIASRRYE